MSPDREDGTHGIPGVPGWAGAAALHHYLVCDVFTTEPLQGNQLAVFLDGRGLSTEQMQGAALELNIAETVFLLPPGAGGDVAMRIFTPRSELPFAGSPVLGTAFVAGAALKKTEVVLETGAGAVPVRLEWLGDDVTFGRMSQPIPTHAPFDRADELLQAIGVERSELPVEIYRNGPEHVFVKLADEAAVSRLVPDLAALSRLGVATNCFAGSRSDITTRMFYPAAGIPEDAATGSAAGPLAVHLARHGQIEFGDEITITQGREMGRPSRLCATAFGTRDHIDRIEVGGRAVIVAEGHYRLSS